MRSYSDKKLIKITLYLSPFKGHDRFLPTYLERENKMPNVLNLAQIEAKIEEYKNNSVLSQYVCNEAYSKLAEDLSGAQATYMTNEEVSVLIHVSGVDSPIANRFQEYVLAGYTGLLLASFEEVKK